MVVIILSLIDQINYIDEQERVRLLREDFSYAMVHDMKSPLSSIIMGTKYLHSGVLEKKPEICWLHLPKCHRLGKRGQTFAVQRLQIRRLLLKMHIG